LKTFRGRCDSLLYQICLGARRKVPWRSEVSRRSTIFVGSPVVGVPIAEVVNTLANWLHWMASSYVGRLDTKTTSSRSACLNPLGLAISWYVCGLGNLVRHPRCVTFRGRCALVACQPALDTQDFMSGMKASLWGARLMVPPSISEYLGAFHLRPS
jgi:hypothetical protein